MEPERLTTPTDVDVKSAASISPNRMPNANFGGSVNHPHPDKQHVVRQIRRYLLAAKKRWGSARGLIHYNPDSDLSCSAEE